MTNPLSGVGQMGKEKIRPVKYIFLDVVAFTRRSIESQCDVVEKLNEVVKSSVDKLIYEHNTGPDSVMYIPTGDGICIALIDVASFDIHVAIAKDILRRLWAYNQSQTKKSLKFEVRIGINQCDDNLLPDINGRENVAGAGVNNARRIMDLADRGQILVSRAVYDSLNPRRKYYNAFSSKYPKKGKHGVDIEAYQLVKANIAGLNTDPPSSFAPTPEPKLPKLSAYYFAHAIKNEEFILKKLKEDVLGSDWLPLLLWFLALDSKTASEATPYTVGVDVMPDTGSTTMEGHFKWFRTNIPHSVAMWLEDLALDDAVPETIRENYLEPAATQVIVNPRGKEKLKADWPEIWDEFGLGEPLSI